MYTITLNYIEVKVNRNVLCDIWRHIAYSLMYHCYPPLMGGITVNPFTTRWQFFDSWQRKSIACGLIWTHSSIREAIPIGQSVLCQGGALPFIYQTPKNVRLVVNGLIGFYKEVCTFPVLRRVFFWYIILVFFTE